MRNSLFEANFKSILGLFYASLWLKQSLLGLWRASEAFLASLDLLRPIYGLCKGLFVKKKYKQVILHTQILKAALIKKNNREPWHLPKVTQLDDLLPLYCYLCIDHIYIPTSREHRNIVQLCTRQLWALFGHLGLLCHLGLFQSSFGLLCLLG